MSASASSTLAGARPTLVQVALVIALTLVLAASARVAVPFWPVPMTLQTLAVLVIAGFAGPRVATAAMLAYLVEGACGLPVFAGTPERGIGLGYMMGPTGGYLAGMLVASALVGTLVRRAPRNLLAVGGAMLLGLVVVYAMGAAWLATFVGAGKAVTLGVVPFLLGDAVKLTLATAMLAAAGRPRRA